MIRLLKNEKGYTLVLTLAVILIFTVLGLSLLTITTNGIAKNQMREDIVQSTDLADKGTEYMIKNLQLELESYITSGNVGKKGFKDKLTSLLTSNSTSCKPDGSGGIEIPGDTGNTKVCIDNTENVYGSTGELLELKKKVTLISTGLVDGKVKKTTTEVVIGTDAIPDQLRYSLSTNNGGNLYLHGGVEVQGDIKTDGNLILSSNATWFSGNTPIWQPSVRAKLTAGPGSVAPKVIFSKENKGVYDLKLFQEYANHISGVNLGKTGYYNKYNPALESDQNSISKLFFNSPQISVLTKTSISQDTLEITSKITDKYKLSSNKNNYTTNLTITSSDHATRNYSKTDVVFVSDTGTESVQETYTYYEDVCVRYKGKKCVEWEQQEKTGTRTVEKDTYKLGNMTINGGSGKKDITLKGTYYVYGDLVIQNVNLKADAIIYVQGNVKITESTINGVDDKSTLLIFANGNIDISNMSVDSGKDGGTKIKGFFYTKQDMLMYGVGSNINLTGGISARRLILTALRGDTKNGYLTATQQAELNNNKVASQYSRLKVIYDQDLISTYTSFKRDEEEEYITSLSDPEIVKRNN